ncbi:MAG: FAD-binding domain-containing protein, partial [Carnobacterium sp.]
AWQQGQTGIPIVDAGMRQLLETGWMHNRLRMIAASFLVKDLLMDWRLGEAYFAEKLIDYDAASNIGGWQWAASTGTDAVPYFRIFNPTTQSQRFDEAGDFIYKYVPELKGIPHAYLHEPSKMPLNIQEEKQIIIGEDYPQPIVQHKLMRQKALELFKGIDQ